MELGLLVKEIENLLNADVCDFPRAILRALMSAEKDRILSAYTEMVNGDLQTDELQKIFQYYHADRKGKKQDYTPTSIGKLCSAATKTYGNTVYDLCAGSGSLTIQKWVKDPQKFFICEELDERAIPFLLFNMAARNIEGCVINRNALNLECKKVYRLSQGKRFSEIEEIDQPPDIEADEIVSNPPYNIKWDPPVPMMADGRFKGKSIPPASNANFAFVLTALERMKKNGRCAFVLPVGSLSSDGAEKEVRAQLIDAGMVERVIILPNKMFESTDIATCVIVFSGGNGSVKLYDCRQKAVQEQREQNGQFGGASHKNRTYKKIINVLSDDVIDIVCGECIDVAEFSREVEVDEIARNNYNLVPSKYIPFDGRKTLHRPYQDIMADINRVERERSAIKITCNETIAREIGLDKVAELEAQSNDADVDKIFELLGGKYESRRYIALSKNKNEFKVENQDKEILSSLILFFLPMWKQHVFYMNKEENRLLAELRDAMIPDLMEGKIKVGQEDL